MKNKIPNKKAGTIIIAGMLCAMLTAGCTQADSNTATTTTIADTTFELVESSEFDGSGVSIEGKSDYGEAYATSLAELVNNESSWYYGSKITYEEIKDVITISAENVGDDDVLDEKVTVKLPYEKGMHILSIQNGVAYDIPAEYIDGKYVFKTNKLGEFVISTVPTGKKKPAKTKRVKLAQQTITDERTGVKVSGMLPVDAKMEVSLYCMDDTDASHVIEWATCYEDVYPKTPELLEYAIAKDTETDIEEMINYEGWGEAEFVSNGAKIGGSINFIKDFEVLDFESDITVTLPFDYHHALDISVLDADYLGKATAIQYDYDKRKFVELDIVPEKETEKDTFQFTAKFPGYFFLGGEERIDDFKLLYTNLNNGEY